MAKTQMSFGHSECDQVIGKNMLSEGSDSSHQKKFLNSRREMMQYSASHTCKITAEAKTPSLQDTGTFLAPIPIFCCVTIQN